MWCVHTWSWGIGLTHFVVYTQSHGTHTGMPCTSGCAFMTLLALYSAHVAAMANFWPQACKTDDDFTKPTGLFEWKLSSFSEWQCRFTDLPAMWFCFVIVNIWYHQHFFVCFVLGHTQWCSGSAPVAVLGNYLQLGTILCRGLIEPRAAACKA